MPGHWRARSRYSEAGGAWAAMNSMFERKSTAAQRSLISHQSELGTTMSQPTRGQPRGGGESGVCGWKPA